jgi:anaerobic selenocysteine-containing dehydrogenase
VRRHVIQLNFGETVGNPWIDDIVFRDPVHTTFLMNAKTGQAKGLADGDIVELESPYGKIFGRVSLSQGVHPETVARVKVRKLDGLPAGLPPGSVFATRRMH